MTTGYAQPAQAPSPAATTVPAALAEARRLNDRIYPTARVFYADPFVEDSNYDGIRTDSTRRVIGLDGNSAAIRHRFNGISEEIHKKLDDLTGIALDLRQLVWAAQFDLHLLLLSS